jgi:hypothetical protein
MFLLTCELDGTGDFIRMRVLARSLLVLAALCCLLAWTVVVADKSVPASSEVQDDAEMGDEFSDEFEGDDGSLSALPSFEFASQLNLLTGRPRRGAARGRSRTANRSGLHPIRT